MTDQSECGSLSWLSDEDLTDIIEVGCPLCPAYIAAVVETGKRVAIAAITERRGG